MASSLSASEEISALLQKQKNWEQRISFLYKKEIMADCFFVIGEGEDRLRIPAHKFVLSACSKEFYNLYFLMESDSNEIFLHDFSIEILDKFLMFVYNNSASLSMDEVWEILRISRLYGVEHIVQKCIDCIGQNMTDENVFTVLNRVSSLDLPTVDLMCLDLIKKKTVEILQNPSFLELDRENLQKVLEHDNLPGKEIEIYRRAISWVDHNLNIMNLPIGADNRRNVLGSVLKEIRFGAMTIKEFIECTEDESFILSKDEIIDVYKCIGSSGKKHSEFSRKNREKALLPQMCLRIRGTLMPTSCVGSHNCVQFSVDKDIVFCGLGLFGRSIYKNKGQILSDYRKETVSFYIEDIEYNKLAENCVEVVYDGSSQVYEVFLSEEQILFKDKTYGVSVKREGPCGLYWGSQQSDEVQCDGVTFKFLALRQYYKDFTTAGILFKKT